MQQHTQASETAEPAASFGPGDLAVARAREMYRRTVTGWAHDALRLRASGLDRPTRRIGRPGAVRPTVSAPGRAA